MQSKCLRFVVFWYISQLIIDILHELIIILKLFYLNFHMIFTIIVTERSWWAHSYKLVPQFLTNIEYEKTYHLAAH